jgi:hypothetical protein
MPIFESLEVKSDELPRPVIPRALAQSWFPALTSGQAAAVTVLAAIWLVRGLLPLAPGPLWAQAAAGRAIVEQAAGSSWGEAAAAARAVGAGWLGDLALYGASVAAGDEGLVLLQTGLVTFACGLLLTTLRVRRLGWGAAGGLTAVAAVGITLGLPAGLPWFGLVGLAALGWLLASFDRRPWARWLLPGLFAAWANLDASFLLGLGWLAAWGLGRTVDRWRCAPTEPIDQGPLSWAGGAIVGDFSRESQRGGATDAVVAMLCVAACAVQPLGWAGFSSAWARLADLGPPLAILSWGGGWFLLSMASVAVLLRTSLRRISASEALVASLAAVAVLASAACLPLWAVVWAWATAAHWMAVCRAWRRDEPLPEAGGVRALIALAAVFLAIMWSPPSHFLLTGQPRLVGQIMAPGTPLALAAEIEERRPSGAAYFAPPWADYLAWRGRRLIPLASSLVPSRRGVWRDAAAIGAANQGWLEIADHYQLRYLIASRQATPELAAAVQREKRCRVLYQDQQGLLVELLPATPNGGVR